MHLLEYAIRDHGPFHNIRGHAMDQVHVSTLSTAERVSIVTTLISEDRIEVRSIQEGLFRLR